LSIAGDDGFADRGYIPGGIGTAGRTWEREGVRQDSGMELGM
jgi:hypothetical protein